MYVLHGCTEAVEQAEVVEQEYHTRGKTHLALTFFLLDDLPRMLLPRSRMVWLDLEILLPFGIYYHVSNNVRSLPC